MRLSPFHCRPAPRKATAVATLLGAQSRLGLLSQLAERRLVEYRDVSQHLAVDFHARQVQAVDHAAIGQTVLASSRVDAGDPQGAELPFALPAITIGILTRLRDRLVGDPEGLTAHAVIAFRLAKNLLVARFGGYAAFYSCHALSLPKSVIRKAANAALLAYRPQRPHPSPAACAYAWSTSW